MTRVIQAALVIVGVIHLLPAIGVLGERQLSSLYGMPFSDANLIILMRHRAVLFGILGAFLIYAAFRPELRTTALVAGSVSVAAFIALAWGRGYNPAIANVVRVDGAALVALVVAGAIHWRRRASS